MILYIKIENGQPVDHPVADWNLIQVFNKIPADYEPFLRTQKPELGMYEVEELDVPQYGKDADGMWTDLWPIRPMTPEEQAAKEAEIIDQLESTRTHLIQMYEDNASNAKNDKARGTALAYVEVIRTLVLRPDEDFTFPQPPIVFPDGDILPSNDESGTAPAVIG